MRQRRIRNMVHNITLIIFDIIAFTSWVIGVSAIDCPVESMKLLLIMIFIPIIYGALRVYAERG